MDQTYLDILKAVEEDKNNYSCYIPIFSQKHYNAEQFGELGKYVFDKRYRMEFYNDAIYIYFLDRK
jgi:hypothetical protein